LALKKIEEETGRVIVTLYVKMGQKEVSTGQEAHSVSILASQ
jgi:hypothetical protein